MKNAGIVATDEAGRTRRVLAGFGLLLIAVGLVAGASWWSAGRVERDLTGRASVALDATGLEGAVTFEGRDATLTGTATDVRQARLATAVVSDMWGVRQVTTDVSVAPTPAPSPPPSPAPTPTPAASTPVVIWPDGSVTFASGRADLSPTARAYLDRVSIYLRQTPSIDVLITGYTDSVGPMDLNRALSRYRADVVAAYLAQRGVGTSRLQTQALGSAAPVTSNDTSTGRSVNRRVELVFQERS